MDIYEIEDLDTGVKLRVEGDAEPSQQDAHELAQREFSDIATNLHEFPGGRYILNVGPTQPYFDKTIQIEGKLEAIDKQAREKRVLIDQLGAASPRRETASQWQSRLKSAMENYAKTNTPPIAQDGYRQVAEKVPDNTLTILAHGGQTPDSFQTEWGHKFTMSNIAKILGPKSNTVQRIINAACYGAGCPPEKYRESFPNVTNIKHSNTNFTNLTSAQNESAGKFITPASNEVEWNYSPQAWRMVLPSVNGKSD